MALFRISKRYVLAVRSEYRGHISGARLVISAIIWYHHHKQGTLSHWQCLKELRAASKVVVVVSGNWVCQILAGEKCKIKSSFFPKTWWVEKWWGQFLLGTLNDFAKMCNCQLCWFSSWPIGFLFFSTGLACLLVYTIYIYIITDP